MRLNKKVTEDLSILTGSIAYAAVRLMPGEVGGKMHGAYRCEPPCMSGTLNHAE